MADVFRADSAQVARASVFQLIEGHALSGRLIVEDRGVEAGWADFVDGRPVDASRGASRGLDALYDLLTIDAGVTRFAAFEPGREPAVTQTLGEVLPLVMEGCRLRDEFVRLGPIVAAPPSGPPPDGTAEVVQVLARLDGRTSIAEAIAHAGVSPSLVIDELRELFETGFLSRSHSRSAVPADSQERPMDFHEALESGRRYFRVGELDRAEADILAALGLRPEDRIALQNLRRVREVRARQWIERIPHK